MKHRIMWVACLFVLLGVVACKQDSPLSPATEKIDETDLTFDPAAKAVQRPFSDYTSTQGTFCFPDGEGGCIDFEPPMKNFLGWGEGEYYFNGLFEYLGNADLWLQEQSGGTISLGTEISGTVTERPLADGRALIQINVHAHNILAWVTVTEDYYLDPLAFGYRVTDVLDGAPPARGDFHFFVRFFSRVQNGPIPDLFQLLLFPEPGQEILHVTVNASATGVLHEASGYPEGTIGRVKIQQVFPHLPEEGYPVTGWPVERLDIRPLGRP